MFVSKLARIASNAQGPPPLLVRALIAGALPLDPLNSSNGLPSIGVIIPATQKDLGVLAWAVESLKFVSNPITSVTIISPDLNARDLPHGVDLTRDEETIPPLIMDLVRRRFPQERWGWVLQQAAKIIAVLSATESASLVLDADTVLIAKRAFLDTNRKQLLCPSIEFHQPYATQFAHYWGVDSTSLSFVTHHQLMQKDILEEMFPLKAESVAAWIDAADPQEPSSLSEYHCYGAWVTTFHPDRATYGRFRNRSIATLPTSLKHRATAGSAFGCLLPLDSVSFHAHLRG